MRSMLPDSADQMPLRRTLFFRWIGCVPDYCRRRRGGTRRAFGGVSAKFGTKPIFDKQLTFQCFAAWLDVSTRVCTRAAGIYFNVLTSLDIRLFASSDKVLAAAMRS